MVRGADPESKRNGHVVDVLRSETKVHKLDHLHRQPKLCPLVANKVLDSFDIVVGSGLVFL